MSPRSLGIALAGVLSSFVLLSCSSETTGSSSGETPDAGAPASSQPPPTTLFSRAITSVTIEIDYAPGAEPYQGNLKDFGDPWTLFKGNSLSIFDGKKTVTFPKTLAKMEKLDDVEAKNYSSADILAIAAAHRTEPQYTDAVSFYIVFVDGYWIDDAGTEQKEQLGVSIGDTGVIAMFKPAISTPVMNPTPPPQYIEQLALIHLLGHAVGFVDNGVPVGEANRAHVDTENVHHCTNKQCAMSFAVETASGAAKAYLNEVIRIPGPEAVLIGQECLSDARLLEEALGKMNK